MRPLYALLAALAALLVGVAPALALPADDATGPGTAACTTTQTALDDALAAETAALAALPAELDAAALADLDAYLAALDPEGDAAVIAAVQAAITARADVDTARAARDTACAEPTEPTTPTVPTAPTEPAPGEPCTVAGVTGTTSSDGDCLIGTPTTGQDDDALPVGGVDTGDGSTLA